jgi:hypothetical protein
MNILNKVLKIIILFLATLGLHAILSFWNVLFVNALDKVLFSILFILFMYVFHIFDKEL